MICSFLLGGPVFNAPKITRRDTRPEGGIRVDASFDQVALTSVPEPGVAAMAGLAVLIGVATRHATARSCQASLVDKIIGRLPAVC
jgi:hypothetical protein